MWPLSRGGIDLDKTHFFKCPLGSASGALDILTRLDFLNRYMQSEFRGSGCHIYIKNVKLSL
jgi:hypothetical protein